MSRSQAKGLCALFALIAAAFFVLLTQETDRTASIIHALACMVTGFISAALWIYSEMGEEENQEHP
jgi:threonine/homoserine efflux transporter RhtA